MAKKATTPRLCYSESLTDSICDHLSKGLSLTAVLQLPAMPSSPTVFKWLREHPEFAHKYAHARETQCEVIANQIIDLADNARQGQKIEQKEIGRVCSTCSRELKWRRPRWRHIDDGSDICDQAKADKVVEEKIVTGDMIERSRLQVDARKWYLSKVMPKKYGDRLELAGDADNPVQITLSVAETLRQRRLERLQQQKGEVCPIPLAIPQ